MSRRLSPALAAVALLIAAIGPQARAQAFDDPNRYVDPLIGTDDNGHVFPGATLPFGMVQLSPSNDERGWAWTSGYHWDDKVLKGFAHTHISGAGLSALGDILLAPAREPTTRPGTAADPDAGYRSRFSHANETAAPGYYRVRLDDPRVTAELTATPRTGFHRYAFEGDGEQYIIVDPTHAVGDHTTATGLEIVSDREIRGYKRSFSQSTGDRTVHFVARFSRPFLRAGLTEDDAAVEGRARDGRRIKAFVQFDPADGDVVEVVVAISHVSHAGALANFAAEAEGRDFDQVRRAADDLWRERLSRITVEETSQTRKRLFYTAEYHASLSPNLISDVTGEYYVEGRVRRSSIPQFSNFSTWDTYRAQHPLLTIVDQETTGEVVASMVSRHADEGLLLPSWEAVGHDNRVMIGYSIVSPIADAVLKGVPGVDPEAAYAAIRASAFDLTKHSNVYDANGMEGYLAYGFVPADVASSVSKTTEQNYEDWVIGRVAGRLGRDDDAALFARRATGYRNLFDAESGYLLPRLAHGRPVEVATDRWDSLNRHYVSGNIWAYSAYTPHDMEAAIRLHGGREAYARWLESIFTNQEPIDGEQHVDISGFIGRYGHGDEPGHHMAWLFNLTGQPWRTQHYVNRVLREMYADRPAGLVNNEDLGQMSAWYVFGALGFYPLAPGDLTYQLAAPLQPRASIRLESGRTFTVEAENLSDDNIYVQSATLNGRPYEASYITHETVMAGGVLCFVMGPQPNRSWGEAPAETSLGAFDDRAPVEVVRPSAWAPQDPDPTLQFSGHRLIELTAADPGAAIHYTLDGSVPTPESPRYDGPIRIEADTRLRAIAVAPGRAPSTVLDRSYFETVQAGLDPPYPAIRIAEPNMPYGRADGSMLVDQVLGTRFYGDKKWSGREGDITALFDLGQPRRVRAVSVGYLDDPMNGILSPSRIEVRGGDAPDSLTLVGALDIPPPPAIRQVAERVEVDLTGGPHRYYQVHVRSFGDLPLTLSEPGRTPWLFLDEIMLR